jgi:hypothetical protein
MSYRIEHRTAKTESEIPADIADLYVVRGAETAQAPGPSPELLAAIDRLAPATRALMRELLSVGFHAMVRK